MDRCGKEFHEEILVALDNLNEADSQSSLPLKGQCHYHRGSIYWSEGKVEEALHHRRQALHCCEQSPSPDAEQRIFCLTGVAWRLLEVNRLDEVEA